MFYYIRYFIDSNFNFYVQFFLIVVNMNVLRTGPLLVAKAAQNQPHASFTNNLHGSTLRRVNSLRSNNTRL